MFVRKSTGTFTENTWHSFANYQFFMWILWMVTTGTRRLWIAVLAWLIFLKRDSIPDFATTAICWSLEYRYRQWLRICLFKWRLKGTLKLKLGHRLQVFSRVSSLCRSWRKSCQDTCLGMRGISVVFLIYDDSGHTTSALSSAAVESRSPGMCKQKGIAFPAPSFVSWLSLWARYATA